MNEWFPGKSVRGGVLDSGWCFSCSLLPPAFFLFIQYLRSTTLPAECLVSMTTGGILCSVAGWRYTHCKISTVPLVSGGVSESLNNDWETPHSLSLCFSITLALMLPSVTFWIFITWMSLWKVVLSRYWGFLISVYPKNIWCYTAGRSDYLTFLNLKRHEVLGDGIWNYGDWLITGMSLHFTADLTDDCEHTSRYTRLKRWTHFFKEHWGSNMNGQQNENLFVCFHDNN